MTNSRTEDPNQRHRTPMGPFLLRARNLVVNYRITPASIRTRGGYSTRDARDLFDKTVLRRAVVEAKTIGEIKQILHEMINML